MTKKEKLALRLISVAPRAKKLQVANSIIPALTTMSDEDKYIAVNLFSDEEKIAFIDYAIAGELEKLDFKKTMWVDKMTLLIQKYKNIGD